MQNGRIRNKNNVAKGNRVSPEGHSEILLRQYSVSFHLRRKPVSTPYSTRAGYCNKKVFRYTSSISLGPKIKNGQEQKLLKGWHFLLFFH